MVKTYRRKKVIRRRGKTIMRSRRRPNRSYDSVRSHRCRRSSRRRRSWYDGNEQSSMSAATRTSSSAGSSVGINTQPTDDERSVISRTESYLLIRKGLKKSIPAAIVLWAFYKVPPGEGLTSRRVVNLISRYYDCDSLKRSGTTVGSLLNDAVEFGLLERRGNKYFMFKKAKKFSERKLR